MGAKMKKHPQKKNPANVSLLALYVGIVVLLTEARVRALQGPPRAFEGTNPRGYYIQVATVFIPKVKMYLEYSVR